MVKFILRLFSLFLRADEDMLCNNPNRPSLTFKESFYRRLFCGWGQDLSEEVQLETGAVILFCNTPPPDRYHRYVHDLLSSDVSVGLFERTCLMSGIGLDKVRWNLKWWMDILDEVCGWNCLWILKTFSL